MPKEKKESEKKKNWLPVTMHILKAISYGALFSFLLLNILFSQQIPLLSTPFLEEQNDAVITFLKLSKDKLYFQRILPEMRGLFQTHTEEIYADEKQRKELIQKLEGLLAQNPQSRDVLYSLYLLYQKNGDETTAQSYLQQAKSIDPGIN
jgi:tetratricopeptide (TPR) repeat protein